MERRFGRPAANRADFYGKIPSAVVEFKPCANFRQTIRPIDTTYKGYRFRSRLEARWAVALDTLGVEWEYEKEGYDLGVDGWYLPDFWISAVPEIADDADDPPFYSLPPANIWAEVKPRVGPGQNGRIDPLKKPKRLSYLTRTPVLILAGVPIPDLGYPILSYQYGELECYRYFRLSKKAASSARAARFEHGERERWC